MPNTYLKGTIFIPSSLVITAITQATQAVVTCIVNSVTEANTYIPGMLVRLFVPSSYGMFQADGQTVKIISISGLNFTLNIDSSQFDAFVAPSGSSGVQPATIAPNGSRNYQYNNQSMDVPFQSLNNIGN
jgi:hypothetical protein